MSFQRSIPFQSQLKIHYICIYIIYTYTVYPLISIEFPCDGKETGRGPPFAQHFKNCPFCWLFSPLSSPSIKINFAHFFFMFPLFLHDLRRLGKKVLHIEKFYINFSFSLHFQEHNHDLLQKSLLEYLTSIKNSVQQHQKSLLVFVTALTIFHYYIYPKLCPSCAPLPVSYVPYLIFFILPQVWTVLPLPTNPCEKIGTAVPQINSGF